MVNKMVFWEIIVKKADNKFLDESKSAYSTINCNNTICFDKLLLAGYFF